HFVRRAVAQDDARVGDEAVGAVEQQDRLRTFGGDEVLEVDAPVVQFRGELLGDVPRDAGRPVVGRFRLQVAVADKQAARVDRVAADRIGGGAAGPDAEYLDFAGLAERGAG